MSNQQELVLEVLLLKSRYSDKDIKAVARALEKQPGCESLSDLLNLLARFDAPSKRSRKKKDVSRLLQLKETHPEYYEDLLEFQTRLTKREVLAETGELRQFVQELGIKDVTGQKREQTIKIVMEALATFSPEDGKALIEKSFVTPKGNSGDFGRLADAILQREHKPLQSE